MQGREPEIAPLASFPQPIAGPVILGLYAYAGSIMTIAPWLAGWISTQHSLQYATPFVFMFGGVAQFSAAMWAFRSRQAIATVISTAWATEHAAWAILYALFGASVFPHPQGAFPGFGIWYIALGWITWFGAAVAIRLNLMLALTLVTGAIAATLLGFADALGAARGVIIAGGWIIIFSAVCAWYTASAMLLQESYGRWILPVWPTRTYQQAPKVSPGIGEAGVMRGK